MRTKRKQQGFTLLEIMLVVSIIVIILGVAISKLGNTTAIAKTMRDQADVATLRKHERFLSNNRTGSAGAGNPTAERPETCSLVSVVQGTANRSLEQRLYLSQSWSEESRRLRFIFGRA